MVDHAVFVPGTADTDSDTRKIVSAESLNYGFNAFMPAMPAMRLYFYLPEDQVDIVMNNDYPALFRIKETRQFQQRVAAVIHVSHGLGKKQFFSFSFKDAVFNVEFFSINGQ